VAWMSDAGNLRVEFDVNRAIWIEYFFQAPMGMRLLSGRRWGSKAGVQNTACG